MEQIMEKTMAKIYNTILFLLIASFIYAQTSPPSGYTTHYKLRMWSQGARPSADSLNQNWKDLDSVIYKVSQSVTIDTTQIAYKNKNNTFTNENNFTGKLSSTYLITTEKVVQAIEYHEMLSGTYFTLTNNTPVIVLTPAGYDSLVIHGIRNWEDGLEFEIINLSDVNVYLMNGSPLTAYYKIYNSTRENLSIPYYGAVKLRGVEISGSRFFVVISKSF